MDNKIMIDWFSKSGKLRTVLFTIAVIGTIILFIVYPPYYFIPSKLLILPFPFLILLTLLGVAFEAIIIVECIRITASRVTSSWNLRVHFTVVILIFLTLVGLRAAGFKNTSNRYYEHAWSLNEKKEFTTAITCLDIALKYDSRNQGAYIERGYAYRQLGNYQKALKDYDTLISTNLHYAKAYSGRGKVYFHLKEYQKALKDWHQAIEIDPNISSKLDKWIEASEERLNQN